VYESRTEALLPRAEFIRRLLEHLALAGVVLIGSVAIGMVGYHQLEQLSWLDAFLNTAMLLGGMGPVDPPRSDAGKLFAGLFALYAGLVFIVTAAMVFTPVVHRVLHRFHWTAD
jgi:hypothetical protein